MKRAYLTPQKMVLPSSKPAQRQRLSFSLRLEKQQVQGAQDQQHGLDFGEYMKGIEKDRGGQDENQGGEKGQAARAPEPEAEKVDQHGQQGAEQSQERAQHEIEQGRGQFEKKERGQGQGDARQVVGIDLFIALAPGAVGGQLVHAAGIP